MTPRRNVEEVISTAASGAKMRLQALVTSNPANTRSESGPPHAKKYWRVGRKSKERHTPTQINDLPNEILAAIFETGAALNAPYQLNDFVDEYKPEDDEDDKDIDESWNFSTIVSHVCSRWRSCALATPKLWTRITMEEGAPFEKTKTWLARSKAAKLEIDIAFPPEDEENASEMFTIALSFLLPHLPRWYDVDLHFDTYIDLYHLLVELKGKTAPELKFLVLNYTGDEDYDHELFPAISFLDGPGSAPKLQSIGLWSTPIPLTSFPWEPSQASQLDIAYMYEEVIPPNSQLTQLLSSFNNLRLLRLGNFGPTWDLPDLVVEDCILLPNLQSILLFSFENSQDLEQLIRCLKMPALKHLTLEDLYDDDQPGDIDFAKTLTVLSRRPEALTLEKVALLNVYISSMDVLLDFFGSCRAVKHIHLSIRQINPFSTSYNDLLKLPLRNYKLQPIRNLPKLCAHLETAALEGFSGKTLILLTSTFQKDGRPLAKLWYSERDDISKKVMKELEKNVGKVFELEASSDEESDENEESGDED